MSLKMPKIVKGYPPVHPKLAETINRLLSAISETNPLVVTHGVDPCLEVAAKALGMTYEAARSKMSNGNVAVLSARADVKRKLFSITYGGGTSL